MKLTYDELEARNAKLEEQLVALRKIKSPSTGDNFLLQTLLNTIPSPIFYKDIQGIYQNCNDAFCDVILGIPKEKIIKKSLFDLPDLIPHELAKIYYEKDQVLFDNPGTQIYQGEVRCSDGVIRHFSFYKATVEDHHEKVIGLVGVMLDVTELKNKKEELKANIKLLERLSYTDSLTGLSNRRKFNEIFPEKLKQARRHDYKLNFAMIDVDNFKRFNDEYGHPLGDKLLQLIAEALRHKLLRTDDYVFRLGGEEFGVLYTSNDETAALNVAHSLKQGVEQLDIESLVGKACPKMTISIGLVSIKNAMEDVLQIYKDADALLYEAKNMGKNRVVSLTEAQAK